MISITMEEIEAYLLSQHFVVNSGFLALPYHQDF